MNKFSLFSDRAVEQTRSKSAKKVQKKPDLISYNALHARYEDEFTRIEMHDIRVSDVVVYENCMHVLSRLPEFIPFTSKKCLSEGRVGKLSGATVWKSTKKIKGWLKAYGEINTPYYHSNFIFDFPEIWEVKERMGR